MMTYYFFSFPLEQTVGSAGFVGIYLISMLVADIPTLIRHRNNEEYVVLYPTMKMGILLLPVQIPAYIFGPLYLAYCYYASRNADDNINHDAHLWGALGGVVATVALYPETILRFL
jgi:membrane associated rhomboid family serine protease